MGIDAALYSGSKSYFFDGNRYIRVTRDDTGPGTVDSGYPKNISVWGWPSGFGSREFIVVHFKSLLPITTTIQNFMNTQYTELDDLFAGSGIEVRRGTTEDLSGNTNLSQLLALDVGQCLLGQPTQEHNALFANRNNAGRPGAAIVQTSARWLLAHEVGHVLGLRHVPSSPATNSDFLMWPNTGWTNTPPNISGTEASTMAASSLSRPF